MNITFSDIFVSIRLHCLSIIQGSTGISKYELNILGLIIWILFGLGYIIMLVNIISHSISKPARKAAQKWAEAEKIMFEKIIREIVTKKSKVFFDLSVSWKLKDEQRLCKPTSSYVSSCAKPGNVEYLVLWLVLRLKCSM